MNAEDINYGLMFLFRSVPQGAFLANPYAVRKEILFVRIEFVLVAVVAERRVLRGVTRLFGGRLPAQHGPEFYHARRISKLPNGAATARGRIIFNRSIPNGF